MLVIPEGRHGKELSTEIGDLPKRLEGHGNYFVHFQKMGDTVIVFQPRQIRIRNRHGCSTMDETTAAASHRPLLFRLSIPH